MVDLTILVDASESMIVNDPYGLPLHGWKRVRCNRPIQYKVLFLFSSPTPDKHKRFPQHKKRNIYPFPLTLSQRPTGIHTTLRLQ